MHRKARVALAVFTKFLIVFPNWNYLLTKHLIKHDEEKIFQLTREFLSLIIAVGAFLYYVLL